MKPNQINAYCSHSVYEYVYPSQTPIIKSPIYSVHNPPTAPSPSRITLNPDPAPRAEKAEPD